MTAGTLQGKARLVGMKVVGDDVLRLSALLLLFYADSSWLLAIPLKIACGAALFSERLLRNWTLWLGITLLIVFINGGAWHSIDNHKYLITYWAICITIALALPRHSGTIVGRNAHVLIGLCFLFSVVWKILAGQFLDGSFLHNVFLTDGRVAVPASIAGGVPLATLTGNRSLESMMQWSPSPESVVRFHSTDALAGIAVAASWWTLLIEGLIAILWLLPAARNSVVKDFALIAFILSTYMLLPVVGFATVLGLMGYAAASVRKRYRLAMVYLGVIAVVQLASIPWGAYVSTAMAA